MTSSMQSVPCKVATCKKKEKILYGERSGMVACWRKCGPSQESQEEGNRNERWRSEQRMGMWKWGGHGWTRWVTLAANRDS